MTSVTSYRDNARMAFPGMRLERLLHTRFYRRSPKARRRLFKAAYGSIAMFKRRFAELRKRYAILLALVKALTAKRIQQHTKVHHTYLPPRILRTQRR